MRKILQICLWMNRQWVKIRLRPIRVYVFHQVSDMFDESTMWKCDWTQTEQFRLNILNLKRHGYTFISLTEAHLKLRNNWLRCKKYAVLTADDGWKSLLNIIPWLAEQNIPVSLFINPAYLDGTYFQSRPTEQLLTHNDIQLLLKRYPHHIYLASHGYRHADALSQSHEEFEENVRKAEKELSVYSNKINFFAFPYGKCTKEFIDILEELKIIPVLVDRIPNYSYSSESVIHRECLDGEIII